MQEMGLLQDGSTVIWQDNQAAIQIAMNRGALAKKTRAMDMRVMTIRNKIEDMKFVLMYLRTFEMIADIGTKALDPKLFTSQRQALWLLEGGMTIATPKEAGDLVEAYRWLPNTRCKVVRGEPLKGSVSYDQRTNTLKGVEKVNDMIDEGQEAIS